MTANTPSSRKAKGRQFQQEIRDALIAQLNIDPVDILSTAMGQNGPDIYLSAAERKKFPYAAECKRTESLQIWAALKQCEDNAVEAKLKPILFFRRNRGKAYAVVELDEMLDLIKNYKK